MRKPTEKRHFITISLILLVPLLLAGGCTTKATQPEVTDPSAVSKAAEKEARAKAKEEEKLRKAEEKRLKKLEKEKRKAEEKARKEEEKRRKKSVVKNPGTPEGKAAEMILKYYEFYFPIMMVFEENETCLRKGGRDKANLCRRMAGVGDAEITKIETFLGAAEELGVRQRTTVAAKIEGTVDVKGRKRKVKREEYFYLDERPDWMEFSDAHGVFRLTFKKPQQPGQP